MCSKISFFIRKSLANLVNNSKMFSLVNFELLIHKLFIRICHCILFLILNYNVEFEIPSKDSRPKESEDYFLV